MGIVFKIPGFIVYFVAGLWGLVICLGIVYDNFGMIGSALSLLVFPATLTLAPWYEAIANSNWFPLLVVYGGGVLGAALVAIGTAIDGD
jgi:hypothetical protein